MKDCQIKNGYMKGNKVFQRFAEAAALQLI
jgi:hypothetical protein